MQAADESVEPGRAETKPAEVRTGVWSRLEEVVNALWHSGFAWLAIGLAPGLALWSLLHWSDNGALGRNALPIPARHGMLAYAGGSLALVTAGYLAFWLGRRKREPSFTLAGAASSIQRQAFVLVLLPILVRLAQPGIATEMPFTALVLTLIAAALVFMSAYRLSTELSFPSLGVLGSRALLGSAVLGYAVLFAVFAIRDHHNLSTGMYDLGIYDNVVWNTSRGDFLASTLTRGGAHTSAHFDPILGLVALPYLLAPRAETLSVLQVMWLASGAIPVWLIARRELQKEWLATLFAVLYLLHPALHGSSLFDFHSLTLSVPFSLWAVYLLDSGARVRYWLVLPLLLACREDVSLTCCFVGVYAILHGRPRTGVATILVSLTYLAIVKLFVMPDSGLLMAGGDESYSYAHFFKEMIPYPKEGVRGFVTTFFTNPVYMLSLLLKPEKVRFFATMLVPLLFLPLFSGKKRVLLVYGFIFLGLATREPVYSTHFQYTSVFLPMLFATLPTGFARVVDSPRLRALGASSTRLVAGLSAGLVLASLLVSLHHGAIVPNTSFRTGFTVLARNWGPEEEKRYTALHGLIGLFAKDAPVSVAEALVPHVSNRKQVFRFPEVDDAEYVLVQLPMTKLRKNLEELVSKGTFRLIERRENFALYKRSKAATPESRKGS